MRITTRTIDFLFRVISFIFFCGPSVGNELRNALLLVDKNTTVGTSFARTMISRAMVIGVAYPREPVTCKITRRLRMG